MTPKSMLLQYSVVLAAVVLGVARLSPHLFFHVPKIGWFLWMISGGEMPPLFDTPSLAQCWHPDNCPWLSSGDVVVDACSKCGTNWMMTTVHEIRTWNQTDLKEFRDILDISPWIELRQFYDDFSGDRYKTWGNAWNDTRLPFKQFKSHLPVYEEIKEGIKEMLVPVTSRPDIKFVVMVRDGQDAVYSMSEFQKKFNPEIASFWGDLPLFNPTISEMVSLFKGEMKSASPFDFFKSWFDYKDYPNVLLLHYGTVFQDQRKYIKIIANFLGMSDIPEENIDEILERVSVPFMKERNHRYRHLSGPSKSIPMLLDDALVREGGVKTAKLTAEEKAIIHDYEITVLSPYHSELLKNGF